MNVGEIKQGIRQRCRFDPILTDNYLLNYAIQALQRFAIKGEPFKATYDINPTSGTYKYQLPLSTINVESVEYGTSDDFDQMNMITLVDKTDYRITKDTTDGFGNVQTIWIEMYFEPDTNKIIRVHYSGNISTILTTLWQDDTNILNGIIPEQAQQPLIEYIAYQHKKSYLKDSFSQMDAAELANAEEDLFKIYNERVETI